MPTINVAVPHRLTQDEAVLRIKNLLGDVKTRYADQIVGLNEAWDGYAGKFSFQAMGMPVTGTLAVKPAQVEISGQLPFAAMFFKDKIEALIRQRAEALLA